jgi:hypothetical protein
VLRVGGWSAIPADCEIRQCPTKHCSAKGSAEKTVIASLAMQYSARAYAAVSGSLKARKALLAAPRCNEAK